MRLAKNLKTMMLSGALLGLLGGSAAFAQPEPPYPPPPSPQDQYQPPPPSADADQYPPDDQAPPPYPVDASAGVSYRGGSVDVGFFYNALAPYGEWVQNPQYGWSWVPRGVPAGWRPYTEGRWVYSDAGWTYVSSYPWGWAPFHYGRWFYDDSYGWMWVPGTVWGPAWVSWRTGGGYIGWAPLPPRVEFAAGIGLRLGGINLDVEIAPTSYTFCEERFITAPRIAEVVVPAARNVTIIRNTTNITSYTVVNNTVVNRGVPVQHIEQVTGRPVQRLRLAAISSASTTRPQSLQTRVQGGTVAVFRPPVVQARSGQAPVPPPAARVPRVRANFNSQADLQRQHEAEQKALETRQAQQRTQLEQIHQRELAQTQQQQSASQRQRQQAAEAQQQQQQSANQRQRQQAAEAQQQGRQRQSQPDLQAQHNAEMRAMQEQQQRERQQLQGQQQRERQAQQQQGRQQPQQQKQEQNRPRDNRERKPENPPPGR